MGRVICFFIGVTTLMACKKLEETQPDIVEQVRVAEGAFVVNEGTFGWNNASLSYIQLNDEAISNQVYEGKNNKPLGDIFQSMIIHNDLGYLAIDQADAIKVIDINTLVETTVITGLNSPRYMLVDEANQILWVTQYNKINLVGLNLTTYEKVYEIDLPDYDIPNIPVVSGSDEMALWQNKLFVSNFRRPYVYQINAANAVVEDSLLVGYAAYSLTLDNLDNLWVATSGDFNKNTSAQITCINLLNNMVVDSKVDANNGFSDITFNSKDNTILVLNNGVKKVELQSNAISLSTLIEPVNNGSFYGLDVNLQNGEIWTTNPLDFQQQGLVYHYSGEGVLKNTYLAGFGPNALVFY